MVPIGMQVPELELSASDGSMVKLSDFAGSGKRLVLFFYPKDSTSG
jgi:peroxiredoxin Q/BCP